MVLDSATRHSVVSRTSRVRLAKRGVASRDFDVQSIPSGARNLRDWFAARVITGKERVIEWYANRGEIPVFFPEAQGRRLFPGYAFFQFDVDLDHWEFINNTHGVIHLLPMKHERPYHLPRAKMATLTHPARLSFVDALKADIAAGGFTAQKAEELVLSYVPGQQVPVINGTHAGCSGELIKYNKGSLVLLMAMFNRKVEVTVPKDCVASSEEAA